MTASTYSHVFDDFRPDDRQPADEAIRQARGMGDFVAVEEADASRDASQRPSIIYENGSAPS